MRYVDSKFFQRFGSFGRFAIFTFGGLIVVGGVLSTSGVVSQAPDLYFFRREKQVPTTIDRGYGPNGRVAAARRLVLGETPKGGGPGGLFGPVTPWPIIPIHMALLPDGRVLTYGTDKDGNQGAQLYYDIWDPIRGTHQTLTQTTSTDIFCSAASLVGAGLSGKTDLTGKMLILGGDLTVDGERNYSNDKVTIFDPADNNLTADSNKLSYARWYPTMTSMPNGSKLLLGGQLEPGTAAEIPELYNPATGWTVLSGIKIRGPAEWYYPRAMVGYDGAVYLVMYNSTIQRIVVGGTGKITDTGAHTFPSFVHYPSAPMSNATPFKMINVRFFRIVQTVDASTNPPKVKFVERMKKERIWGNLTLLPDGRILATGGSSSANELENVAYQSEVFDPDTGHWTLGASAARARLYHSATLLLPDGSVLTGGGGAPGPLTNLNVEIYYPSYLFDADGNPAPRPTLGYTPATVKHGQPFRFTVGSSDVISHVSLVRFGSSTHGYDGEQRLQPIPFYQSGQKIVGYVTRSSRLLPPGYYMLFVFDTKGVPSIAKIVSIPQSVE